MGTGIPHAFSKYCVTSCGSPGTHKCGGIFYPSLVVPSIALTTLIAPFLLYSVSCFADFFSDFASRRKGNSRKSPPNARPDSGSPPALSSDLSADGASGEPSRNSREFDRIDSSTDLNCGSSRAYNKR